LVQLSDIMDALSSATTGQRQSKLYAGEAHILWETLQQRYDYYEFSQIVINNISDSEFKILASKGVGDTMRTQINRLEDLLNTFGIPLPKRPPETVIESGETDVWRDDTIFNLLLMGIQNFLGIHLRGVKLFVSDGLRNLYNEFMVEELKVHDNLVKYGKLKGWLPSPPAYRQRA